jgi:hypothetical protein
MRTVSRTLCSSVPRLSIICRYSRIAITTAFTPLFSLSTLALVVITLVCRSSVVRRPSSTTFTLLLFAPSSFLYPRVMPHFRVVGQSLHIIIRSGRITLTQVSTVSFAVVLYSRRTRTCASVSPITKAFDT